MSLSRTKAQLLKLLADQDSKVIALSGRWGTGKTHLWGEVVAASGDERVTASLYVSLFGLSSVDQIKRKLIESAAPGIEAHPNIWEGAQKAVTAGIKALSGFHKGFEALNDLNLLLLAPATSSDTHVIGGDRPRTLGQLVKDIYDHGRSQILHGTRYDRLESFAAERQYASHLARIVLIESAIRLQHYSGPDVDQAFRTI